MENGKNNALAELAEWIKQQKDGFPVLANQFKWQDDRDEQNIEKVQRIIAELAKVQVGDGMVRKFSARANCLEYSILNEFPKIVGIFTTEHFPKWICSALNAIEKCRTIAEE